MDDTKQKYVRLREYDSIIIFSTIINHSEFKHLEPISAGFCYVHSDKVVCFGESVTLGLKSSALDSDYATKQLFGIDAMLNLT